MTQDISSLLQLLSPFQREIKNDGGISFCQSNKYMRILSLSGKRLGLILRKIWVFKIWKIINTDLEDYKPGFHIMWKYKIPSTDFVCIYQQMKFKINVKFLDFISSIHFIGLLRITCNRFMFSICLLISLEKLTRLGCKLPSWRFRTNLLVQTNRMKAKKLLFFWLIQIIQNSLISTVRSVDLVLCFD